MHQPTENPRVAGSPCRQVIESASILLQCGILWLFITGTVACTRNGQNPEDGAAAQDQAGKSDQRVFLRRGLPGEPRTLDPQLADDTFSFPVLRDLYEGLTAEDRNGQIVPGAAESWTVDKTGTIYTFLLRPNAKWSDGNRTVAQEFVQGMRRAVDPQTASGSSALLAIIKGASEIIAGRKKVT